MLGKTVASSYRPLVKVLKIDIIAKNVAKTPKDSGEYILLNNGEDRINIIWLTPVPKINLITLLLKLFLIS